METVHKSNAIRPQRRTRPDFPESERLTEAAPGLILVKDRPHLTFIR